MEKQISKKETDLPLNSYIYSKFQILFQLVFTTHETRPLCCAQMKAQFLEPLNIIFLPKVCLNKPMHTGTDLDTSGLVMKEMKMY